MRLTVPMSRETQADRHAGRIIIDLAGLFDQDSLAGSQFMILCVDEFSQYTSPPNRAIP